LQPASTYRFKVVPKYGSPGKLTVNDGLAVEVEVTTEDPASHETAVFFNRAAAASKAFNERFRHLTNLADDSADAKAARVWLSNGLEEALLAYLGQAKDKSYALHAAVYEFQKPELLQGLAAADTRGA